MAVILGIAPDIANIKQEFASLHATSLTKMISALP